MTKPNYPYWLDSLVRKRLLNFNIEKVCPNCGTVLETTDGNFLHCPKCGTTQCAREVINNIQGGGVL